VVIVAATVVFLAKAEVVVSAAVLCVNTLPTLALKILRLEQIVLHHLHLPHTLQAGKLSPLHISRRNLSYCNSNIRILLFPINKRNSTGFKFLADRVQQFVREKKTISLVPFFYPFNISYIDLIENTSIVCWWQWIDSTTFLYTTHTHYPVVDFESGNTFTPFYYCGGRRVGSVYCVPYCLKGCHVCQ
jgi:hypothetical protein